MRPRALLLAVVATFALLACGASLRRSHRASAYFEECYAADLDIAVADTERRACWQAWARAYQTGASPERLDYVHERLAMLDPDRAAAIALATGDDGSIETIDEADTSDDETVDAITTTDATTDASTPRTPSPSEAVPADHRDEDQIAEERHGRARERHVHRGILAPRTITPRCPCESEWQGCITSCLADDAGCIGACRREHTLCSRSCY